MLGLDSREAYSVGEEMAYHFELNAYLARVDSFYSWVDSLDESEAPEWVEG